MSTWNFQPAQNNNNNAKNIPIQTVINNVQNMVSDYSCKKIASSQSLAIHSVTYEDCARNKNSVWGPCISDMTLQVNNSKMPVIRYPNFTDKTWDVQTDKIPLIIGNHDNNPGAKLDTISLKEYLTNFHKYISKPPNNKKNINLLRTDPFAKHNDTHVIMSSQCCFLPIEKGKETKFNVALFNYQSKKADPAVLVIVSTSKGTSAQIIEGNQQKLLFNNYGIKADFIGQRLTDNRIERNVSIHGAMTKKEKQDNCIVIIQIPLKQKPKIIHQNIYNYQYQSDPFIFGNNINNWSFGSNNNNNSNMGSNSFAFGASNNNNDLLGFGAPSTAPNAMMPMPMNGSGNMMMNDCFGGGFGTQQPQQQQQLSSLCSMNQSNNNFNNFSSKKSKKKMKKKPSADVESAIVKIAPKTIPQCICKSDLVKKQTQHCYINHHNNFNTNTNGSPSVNCDVCSNPIVGLTTYVWHCPLEKNHWKHKDGYDLCMSCGNKQLEFDELNGLQNIERDVRYPIRVTLQYYKSTNNGVLTNDIMKSIKKLLDKSQQQADYIGSLVTDNQYRPTKPDLHTKNQKIIHHVHNVIVPKPVPVINDNPFDFNIFADNKYKEIETILKQCSNKDWKVYLNNFKNEEVTDNDLKNLDKSDLMQLIPKMGPRNRFVKFLENKYPKNNDNSNFMSGFI